MVVSIVETYQKFESPIHTKKCAVFLEIDFERGYHQKNPYKVHTRTHKVQKIQLKSIPAHIKSNKSSLSPTNPAKVHTRTHKVQQILIKSIPAHIKSKKSK